MELQPTSNFTMAQRVLLSVEDNDSEYYLIKMAVEQSGLPIQLCRAADGEEAMVFLQKSRGFELAPRPDLILLNMHLPKKHGLDVLTEIRQSDRFRSIPVVMFTSVSGASERNRALASGAADFISKPHTLSGLIEAVRSVCSRFLAQG